MTPRYMPLVDYESIESSAPGRLVLIGEFAEFYEKNAIAFALGCRTKVKIRPFKDGRLRLNLKNYGCIREWPTTSFTMTKLVAKYADVLDYNDTIPNKLNHLLHKRYCLSETVKSKESSVDPTKEAENGVMAFLILYVSLGDSYAWSSRPALDVVVESDIPTGRGLGSSSALGVALCASLMKVFRVSAEPYMLNSWTINIDKFFHGKASGLNTTIIIYGGYVYFQNNKVRSFGSPHSSPLKALLIDTGVRKDPRQVNSLIDEKILDHSSGFKSTFDIISGFASQIWRRLDEPQFDPQSILMHLQACQDQLNLLGLGVKQIGSIRERSHISVKQTQCGATAFYLFNQSNEGEEVMAFKKELENLGYSFTTEDVSCPGLFSNVIKSQSSDVRVI